MLQPIRQSYRACRGSQAPGCGGGAAVFHDAGKHIAETATMPEIPIAGGCQCGAVRYVLRATPVKPCICHCRMCQKAMGNLFGAFAGVPYADFEVTRGDPSSFRSSDLAERLCQQC